VKELKQIMLEESAQKEDPGSMNYMETLEKDIRKMLVIARKK
jgi:hypothetical protein